MLNQGQLQPDVAFLALEAGSGENELDGLDVQEMDGKGYGGKK